MNELITVLFPQIRLLMSQLLVVVFSNWAFLVPVVLFALAEIYELFRKIY